MTAITHDNCSSSGGDCPVSPIQPIGQAPTGASPRSMTTQCVMRAADISSYTLIPAPSSPLDQQDPTFRLRKPVHFSVPLDSRDRCGGGASRSSEHYCELRRSGLKLRSHNVWKRVRRHAVRTSANGLSGSDRKRCGPNTHELPLRLERTRRLASLASWFSCRVSGISRHLCRSRGGRQAGVHRRSHEHLPRPHPLSVSSEVAVPG
jgi:hypothetical protein